MSTNRLEQREINGLEPLPPLISTNRRLLEAYRGSEDLLNIEYTIPVPTFPLYERQDVKADPALQAVISEHLRFIVTPSQAEKLSDDLKGQIKIMTSPPECGRLLEADEQVIIDGKPYTMVFKGVGLTRYFRDGNNELRPSDLLQAYIDPELALLQTVSYMQKVGLMDQFAALRELNEADSPQMNEIDTEQILGVYIIDALPDEQGQLRPIAELQKTSVNPDIVPVILVRAQRSNHRLVDPYNLVQLGRDETARIFIETMKQDFKRAQALEDVTMQEYLANRMRKFVRQDLSLLLMGYPLSVQDDWTTLARNVSTEIEEIDLEDMDKIRFVNLTHFRSASNQYFGDLIKTVKEFAKVIASHGGEAIDFRMLGEGLYEEVDAVIQAKADGMYFRMAKDSPFFMTIYNMDEFAAILQDALIGDVIMPDDKDKWEFDPTEAAIKLGIASKLPETSTYRDWIDIMESSLNK